MVPRFKRRATSEEMSMRKLDEREMLEGKKSEMYPKVKECKIDLESREKQGNALL
jgi:hypothetical protein